VVLAQKHSRKYYHHIRFKHQNQYAATPNKLNPPTVENNKRLLSFIFFTNCGTDETKEKEKREECRKRFEVYTHKFYRKARKKCHFGDLSLYGRKEDNIKMDIKENVIRIILTRDRKELCTPSNMVMNFPLHKEENFGHRTDYLVSTRISLQLIFITKYETAPHFGTSSNHSSLNCRNNNERKL
jgi:hypothetical protein